MDEVRERATRSHGRPFKKGEDSRRGSGKTGRSGRPTNEFRNLCTTLVNNPKTLAAAKSVLRNPKNSQFARLFKALAEFGYGKALTTLDISGAVPTIRVEVVDDPIAESRKQEP